MILTKLKWVLGLSCAGLLAVLLFYTTPTTPDNNQKQINLAENRKRIADQLGPFFLMSQYPEKAILNLDGSDKSVSVKYSLEPEIQAESDKLLNTYKPDYAAIVVVDATTGRILSISSFQKDDPSSPNLALRGTFPSASVFKVVTASAAVDKREISPETQIAFNGANHTLYKSQVMSEKVNRWTRFMSLREAFARSINGVFGRLSLNSLDPKDLEEYSNRFGFNRSMDSDIPFDNGIAAIADGKNFHMAEIASGFNKITRMSPVQGAMIAAAVANEGLMMTPYIVDSIKDEQNESLFEAEPIVNCKVLTALGAQRMRDLMGATVLAGTSRKTFRNITHNKNMKEIEFGGKTGSLTGDNPKGKVDWFVGYGINENHRIAVGAITVNKVKWTVKSSFLAQSLLHKYFDVHDIQPARLTASIIDADKPVVKKKGVKKRHRHNTAKN